MSLTVEQGFSTFLDRLVPTATERAAAASHRGTVKSSLEKQLSVKGYREIGSFGHGTGVRHHADVDLLVSLYNMPGSSDTALNWVKTALQATFTSTPIYVSRPAVVVDFAQGTERWEVIPAFLRPRSDGDPYVYDIAGPAGGWIDTAPVEHIAYVNEVNTAAGKVGGAKALSRLLKAWKYYSNVPVSSFYLEMRAAQHMNTQDSFIPVWDLCWILESLHGHQLASMDDPQQVAGRFHPCSSTSKKTEALSKLDTAATRARKALTAHQAGDPDLAFAYLTLLFNGHFPQR